MVATTASHAVLAARLLALEGAGARDGVWDSVRCFVTCDLFDFFDRAMGEALYSRTPSRRCKMGRNALFGESAGLNSGKNSMDRVESSRKHNATNPAATFATALHPNLSPAHT